MRRVRRQDEGERQDVRGQAEVALHGLRGVRNAQDRLLREGAAAFLARLLSKDAAAELPTGRPTFWRRTSWAWRIWPAAPPTDEVHDVVFLDGIWMRRRAVVLIAVAGGRVIGWHLARSECAEPWLALVSRIPAPAMAISDGARGLAKAAGGRSSAKLDETRCH